MPLRPNDLHIHDSLTRSRRRFEPIVPGHAGIYVCGPTVYSDTHLGHAKSYISFDVVVRYLRHLGYRVRYVQNITDVGHLTDDADEGEDKLQKRARLDQVHPLELAETYTRLYFRDMDALKVTRPDISPRATQHVPEQLELTEKLVETGHAYVAGGSVYFSVTSFPEYGKLSGHDLEESEEGHRVQVRSDKRDPRDFALWKQAEGGHILRWRSPWGWGFPGWHIECSAMSSKYLGEEFDIHGGGLDNQFPHHECEIAQSRAAGMPFARTWMHNNLITVDGRKMSKSLGNFTTVQQALAGHPAEVVRFWVLQTHYRSPADYSRTALDAAAAGLARLTNGWRALRSRLAAPAPAPAPAPGDVALDAALRSGDEAFHRAMDDDFNTPLAIAALFDLVRQVNASLAAPDPLSAAALGRAADLLRSLAGDVLGILEDDSTSAGPGLAADPFVDLLVEARARFKSRKDFESGDWLRARLAALGIELKDAKDGTTWSRA